MGGAFLGSQKQPFKKTVFNTIESVFYTIFKQTIVCIPCGRTDTGVNASYMVFHADFSFLFNNDHLKKRLNVEHSFRLILIGTMVLLFDPLTWYRTHFMLCHQLFRDHIDIFLPLMTHYQIIYCIVYLY